MLIFELIGDIDNQLSTIIISNGDIDSFKRDAWFPAFQSLLYIAFGDGGGMQIHRPKDQLMNLAAKVRAHDALTGDGVNNDVNRLANVGIIFNQNKMVAISQTRRKGQTSPCKFTHYHIPLIR